ncbi:hypothetical protein D3C81_1667580 [compost metagenome]
MRQGAADAPARQQQTKGGHRRPATCTDRQQESEQQGTDSAGDQRPAQLPFQVGQGSALPARERTDAHQHQCRHHQRNEDGIEVRRPDGNFVAAEDIQQQWIKRAGQYRQRSRSKQDVIDQQQ